MEDCLTAEMQAMRLKLKKTEKMAQKKTRTTRQRIAQETRKTRNTLFHKVDHRRAGGNNSYLGTRSTIWDCLHLARSSREDGQAQGRRDPR
jgi:hypothetical protein